MGNKAGGAQNTDTEIICSKLLAADVRVHDCVWGERKEEKKRAEDRPSWKNFITEKLKGSGKRQRDFEENAEKNKGHVVSSKA